MENPTGSLAGTEHERRRSPRYPFDGVLEIEWGSATLAGRVRDISSGGMQVEIADPLWIGASFSARLALDTPLRLDCVVARVEPGRAMGIRFVVPDEADRGRLAGLLATLTQK